MAYTLEIKRWIKQLRGKHKGEKQIFPGGQTPTIVPSPMRGGGQE